MQFDKPGSNILLELNYFLALSFKITIRFSGLEVCVLNHCINPRANQLVKIHFSLASFHACQHHVAANENILPFLAKLVDNYINASHFLNEFHGVVIIPLNALCADNMPRDPVCIFKGLGKDAWRRRSGIEFLNKNLRNYSHQKYYC